MEIYFTDSVLKFERKLKIQAHSHTDHTAGTPIHLWLMATMLDSAGLRCINTTGFLWGYGIG